jgi:hypothetical protein
MTDFIHTNDTQKGCEKDVKYIFKRIMADEILMLK